MTLSIPIVFNHDRAQFRTQYDGEKLIYLGYANASIAEDRKGWIIQKFEYDANGHLLRNYFPGDIPNIGNSYPNHIWTDRETYEYV